MGKLIAAAAAFAVLCASAPAFAQYRTGQPETLAPPPPAVSASAAVNSSFARAYAAHGKPRVVVFWNRELADSVVTPWVSELSVDSYYTPGGRSVIAQSREYSEDPGKRAAQMATAPDWKVQGKYKSAMLAAGVRMIDRRAALRFSAAGKAAGDRANLLAVEAKSLQGFAEILVEILLAPDPDSSTGYVFQTTIIRIKDGEILGSSVTNASTPPRDLGFRPSANGGFERAIEQAPVDAMGTALANATMDSLLQSWR
ncbi:MAG: hypothetical protein AB7M12_02375 [Hyphomonadaceae bacterium]